jgi:cell division protein ZapA (FtsZ GTPase activity inhibitor)
MTEATDIEIFGRTYQVKGQKDPEYTLKLAAYVDAQMRSVADRSPPSASPLQVAVLTLLHVANEFFEARDGQEQSEAAVKEKAEALIYLLDSSLGKGR